MTEKIIYLINGINYDDTEDFFQSLERKLKCQYGDHLNVRVVGAHPYNSNLLKYSTRLRGINKGAWWAPVDWFTKGAARMINWMTAKCLRVVNTVYGSWQVMAEYNSGGSTQSKKVYEWIECNLRSTGLIHNPNVEIILVAHSGGAVIAANIVDDIEEKLGVKVSAIVTMGAPIYNYDHACRYVKTFIDIQHEGDGFGRMGFIGPIRPNKKLKLVPIQQDTQTARLDHSISRHVHSPDSPNDIRSITTNDGGRQSWAEAHNSYWNSQRVVEAIGEIL
jgi:hypothetical protein